MKIIGRRVLHQGDWRTFSALDVELEDGTHLTLEHFSGSSDAVAIVAVDGSDVLLIENARPVAGFARNLELPQGGIDGNETPEQAAQRELREETGYRAERFELLRTHHPLMSVDACLVSVFLATGLTEDPLTSEHPEITTLVRWPVSELDALLERVSESSSVIGLLLLRDRLRSTR